MDIAQTIFSQPAAKIILDLFAIGGYLIFVWLFLYVAIGFYRDYRENKYTADWKWIVLAIDIPPLNVQTPKAIEQMFSHLAGAFESPNIADAFRGGYKQRWFSFEIISIEGYTQFLVRTEETYRDLVEASIYAQYPEAEITEVEDYVNTVPSTYPNDTHDIWAGDFGLAEDDAYPIRNYREFEHSISKDTVLKDPMGAVLENFSRMGPGEQLWLQILIEPIDNGWKEKAIKKIKELIGEKSSGGGNKYVDAMLGAPIKLLEGVGDQVFGREESESSSSSDRDDGEQNKLRYLTPGQTKVIEAMEEKISLIGFKTKMRGVYVARKEVFRPSRGVSGLIGSMTQFNVPTSNSIVPKYGVGTSYFFKDMRSNAKKNLMMSAYKKRKIKPGATPFVLNVVELATVWHFPMSHVKTPMLQKVETKQSEPPIGLPIERLAPQVWDVPVEKEIVKEPGTHTDAYGYTGDMKFG